MSILWLWKWITTISCFILDFTGWAIRATWNSERTEELAGWACFIWLTCSWSIWNTWSEWGIRYWACSTIGACSSSSVDLTYQSLTLINWNTHLLICIWNMPYLTCFAWPIWHLHQICCTITIWCNQSGYTGWCCLGWSQE